MNRRFKRFLTKINGSWPDTLEAVSNYDKEDVTILCLWLNTLPNRDQYSELFPLAWIAYDEMGEGAMWVQYCVPIEFLHKSLGSVRLYPACESELEPGLVEVKECLDIAVHNNETPNLLEIRARFEHGILFLFFVYESFPIFRDLDSRDVISAEMETYLGFDDDPSGTSLMCVLCLDRSEESTSSMLLVGSQSRAL